MAYQIKATNDSNTKPNYIGELQASPVFSDGEFGVFFGSSTVSQVIAANGIVKCAQALRERGWPDPGAGTFNTVVFDTESQDISSISLGAVIPTIEATQIALIQGAGFTVSHDSNSAHSRRLIEAALERYLGGDPEPPAREYSWQIGTNLPNTSAGFSTSPQYGAMIPSTFEGNPIMVCTVDTSSNPGFETIAFWTQGTNLASDDINLAFEANGVSHEYSLAYAGAGPGDQRWQFLLAIGTVFDDVLAEEDNSIGLDIYRT